MSLCRDCTATLTAEELHYYGDRCNRCEGEWSDRIEAWRHGGEDAELSRMFPNEPRTLQ